MLVKIHVFVREKLKEKKRGRGGAGERDGCATGRTWEESIISLHLNTKRRRNPEFFLQRPSSVARFWSFFFENDSFVFLFLFVKVRLDC